MHIKVVSRKLEFCNVWLNVFPWPIFTPQPTPRDFDPVVLEQEKSPKQNDDNEATIKQNEA